MVLISKNPDSNLKVLDKPEEYYRRVIRDLILTLNSRAEAYSDIKDLERDFCDDTGLNPQSVAFEFGFPTFDLFIRSSHVRKYVLIIPDEEGNAVFYPKEDPRIKHIRHHQEVANYATGRKKELDQQDKIARAMAPAFRPQLIEGKRRIIDIAHELGAEDRHITYQQIQEAYLKKYDVILNQVELRKFFQRATPSQILITLFNDEFEFFKDSQMSGMIVLKFKIPYKDILTLHEDMLNFQKDFVKHRPKPMKFVPLNYDRSFPAKEKPKRELNIKPILPSIEKNILDKIQGPDLFGELEETPENQNDDDDPHSDSETNDCVEPSNSKDAVGSFPGKTHRRRYNYSSSEEDSDDDNNGDDRVKVPDTRKQNSGNLSPKCDSDEADNTKLLEKIRDCGTKERNSKNDDSSDTSSISDYVKVKKQEENKEGQHGERISYSTSEENEGNKKPLQSRNNIVAADLAPESKALMKVIVAVVHFRAPKLLELEQLMNTLDGLDPDYEVALMDNTLSEFIELYCKEYIHIGMYNDLVLLGYRG
ncbi:hypothetical protein Ddc_06013 [Ditylenchus destructor]|nr:hypothetical protein Ddc_06013 [Ditylenchus destructor]